MLQEEINQLKSQLDHHPEVTKFAMENYELKGTCAYAISYVSCSANHVSIYFFIRPFLYLCFIAELKRLKEGTVDVTMETKTELSRLHQYTLQLEKQVRGSLRKENQHLEPSISASEVARLNSEIERLHHRCQQLQNDLNQVRNVPVDVFILSPLINFLSIFPS